MNDNEDFVPEQDEPEPEIDHGTTNRVGAAGPMLDEPPGPINWNLLTADDAEAAWLELNQWVNWLRTTYGLPSSVVPPMWHRHPELHWELSALHAHWLCAFDPQQNGSAPIGWHRDFADARQRLRDWVAACEDTPISNRDEDFVAYVIADVERRRQLEHDFYANLNPDPGEIT